MVDTDMNGLLSRDEFSMYSMRTGEEEVGDDEWNVVKGKLSRTQPLSVTYTPTPGLIPAGFTPANLTPAGRTPAGLIPAGLILAGLTLAVLLVLLSALLRVVSSLGCEYFMIILM